MTGHLVRLPVLWRLECSDCDTTWPSFDPEDTCEFCDFPGEAMATVERIIQPDERMTHNPDLCAVCGCSLDWEPGLTERCTDRHRHVRAAAVRRFGPRVVFRTEVCQTCGHALDRAADLCHTPTCTSCALARTS